jgi:hypothetical protein
MKKAFYINDTCSHGYETFFPSSLMFQGNKLECFSKRAFLAKSDI